MKVLQQVAERKHRRRALGPEDVLKVRTASRLRPMLHGISGPDREALYVVATEAGFRASECARLNVRDLHLDAKIPHISLAAPNTKNRDEARIPLRNPETIEFLRRWIQGRSRDEKLWPGNWASNRGRGKMLQHDLKAAGIPYEVEGRKADFHALRYTFITSLIKAGEHPAVVQRLARHSDINLTFRVYADLGLEELYHGLLRDAGSPTAAREQRSIRASENGESRHDLQDGDTGPVAPNVEPPDDVERPSTTSDVRNEAQDGKAIPQKKSRGAGHPKVNGRQELTLSVTR